MKLFEFPAAASICSTISRKEIEEVNVSPLLELLVQLGRSPKVFNLELRERLGCFGLFVSGYDEDDRELFEVPDVRAYFQKLHSLWPYGLFFFARSPETFQLLVLCNAGVRLLPQASPDSPRQVKIDKESVLDFLIESMPALSEVASQIGWTPQMTRRFVHEIAIPFGFRSNCGIEEPEEVMREMHFNFLKVQDENLAALAWRGYLKKGRGLIVVPPPGPNNLSGANVFFCSASEVETVDCLEVDGDHMRLLQTYDPEREVVVAIDDDNLTSAYRYRAEIPPPQAARSEDFRGVKIEILTINNDLPSVYGSAGEF